MNKEQAVKYLSFSGFSDEQIKAIEGAFSGWGSCVSDNPQKPEIAHCKDCKYFEYNSVAKVDGIPLIVAHEICSRWGDGCKTSENGYCFLFEQSQEGGKE